MGALTVALAVSSPPLLPLLLADVHRPDEETSAQALKCFGFMLYHPALVATISEEMARSVLDSLVKLITTTLMKAVCNLAVWCVSIQQLQASVIELEAHSLIRAIVHALDNPFGSLSTTFEATQALNSVMCSLIKNSLTIIADSKTPLKAVMKLASQIPEKMRDLLSVWLPPIYRRLLSANNTERSTTERCLLKMSSIILPPPPLLSEVVTSNLKKELLLRMTDMLHDNLQNVQVIKAWGWYVSLLGSTGLSDRHLLNKLLKIPEKTFTHADAQVQVASLTIFGPMLEVTFSSVLDNQNMCVWNSCINLLHEFVMSKDKEIAFGEEQSCYDKSSWKDHPIKWLPWDINYLDFLLKMIGIIVGPEEMKCVNFETRVVAMNAALKIFKSVLKGVKIEFSYYRGDRPFNTKFPTLWANLDIKYISDLKCPENISHSRISTPPVKALGYMDMVSPMVYTTILSLSLVAQSILKLLPEDAMLYAKQQMNVPFFLVNTLDNLHTVVTFMYMHIKKPIDCRLSILMMWSIIGQGLKEQIGRVSALDSPTVDYSAVHQFLCFPLLLFLSLEKKPATLRSGNCSEFCVFSSQQEVEMELVIEVYKSLHDYSIRGTETVTSSTNDFTEGLCELFVSVLNKNVILFVHNIECCLQKKYQKIAILSVIGEAAIQMITNTKVFGSAPQQSKEPDKYCPRCSPIKYSLGLVSRFLELSLVAFQARPQDEHHVTIRVFEALDNFSRLLFLKQDILLLLELISDPLCQWLSSCAKIYCEIQRGGLINQLLNIWSRILDCLKRSQPPILFNSSFLETQASLLQTTLGHPHPPISDVTIEFWRTTYNRKVSLRYPSCLLPTLEKLSRSGRIILQKDSAANDAFSCKERRGSSRTPAVSNAQKRPLSVIASEFENDHGLVNLYKGFKRKRFKSENGPIKGMKHVERFEDVSGSDCRMDTMSASNNLSERKEPRKPEYIMEMLRRKR
uniref:Telomere-associated protein Rif1 N-terminal domain-containing protein n=1 Tax=Ananas comosus var. bracteatus TaxID=296719 RepID=A0A6V7PA99_ANACO|nr:unnamed protein product [Ananas comosus var. bracteatus]